MNTCKDSDAYDAGKDPLHLLQDINQTHQHAPIGDSLVDVVAAVQTNPTMRQTTGESTIKYCIRMEDKVKVIERL